MLFVTFGGGHSALYNSYILSLPLSLPLILFLSFSPYLSWEYPLETTVDNELSDPRFHVCMYIKIYLFFLLFKKCLTPHNALPSHFFLCHFLSLSFFSLSTSIFSLYTLPRHQLDSKSRHAPASRVQERNREIDRNGATIRHEEIPLFFLIKQVIYRYLWNAFKRFSFKM